jgi:hypothetical protein
MAVWQVTKEWSFEGPGEVGSDVDGGHAFLLKHIGTREEIEFRVELVTGGRGVSSSRVRDVLKKYLNVDDPPRSVKLDRDGNELPG